MRLTALTLLRHITLLGLHETSEANVRGNGRTNDEQTSRRTNDRADGRRLLPLSLCVKGIYEDTNSIITMGDEPMRTRARGGLSPLLRHCNTPWMTDWHHFFEAYLHSVLQAGVGVEAWVLLY